VLADSIKAKQGELLGIPIYLRGTNLNVAGYKDLSAIAPTSTSNSSIYVNASTNKVYLVDKWITAAFAITKPLELPENYIFLFFMFANKSSSTSNNASLFCQIGYYRNSVEYPFFNSSQSSELSSSSFVALAWQSRLSTNYTFQNGDRFYLKVFLAALGSGNFYFAYNGRNVASYVRDPAETRYMRSDTQIINGLTAYKLSTAQSSSYVSIQFDAYDEETFDQYLGVRVWKRATNGSETEISSGTAIAIATGITTALISATWSCPLTSLSLTDAIVVRVYGNDFSPPTTLVTSFITEQLGASSLDASTWTVYYYLVLQHTIYGYFFYFRFGTTTYNSRIANFVTTIPVSGSWHTAILFLSYLSTRQWNTKIDFLSYLSARQWTTPLSFNGYLASRQWQQSLTFLSYLSSRAWQTPLWFNAYLDVKGWRLPITFLAYLESGEDSYLLIAVFALILTLSFIFYLLLHKK
jgi:hypothetical protein